MAQIDKADLKVLKEHHANVSETIGVGEKNEKNDVLLIQVLFKLVGFSDHYAKKYFGLTVKDLPELNGKLDEKTIRAIWSFQRKMSHQLQNVDGKIHPASYSDRVLKKAYQGGRVMVITLLNMLAPDGALMYYNTDVVSAIKVIAPQLIFKSEAS